MSVVVEVEMLGQVIVPVGYESLRDKMQPERKSMRYNALK